MDKFVIPPELSHLKVDPRGYPVPFFVPIVDGHPNFKYMDQKKLDIAIERQLCYICGKKLPKDCFYFITGPLGLQNQCVSDAAMHRKCADFSLKVCPHMLFQKAERKGVNTVNPHSNGYVTDKPSELYLIKASKYKAKFYPEMKQKIVHFRTVSSEKYIYVNNKLIKS